MAEVINEIEAGDNINALILPTREQRVELLKQTCDGVDNIGERLENSIKIAIEDRKRKECRKEFKKEIRNHLGFYNDLRMAWQVVARLRYPHISTLADTNDDIYFLLNENPIFADSIFFKIINGDRDYFHVDDGKDTIKVTDIPSAVKAIKLFDKTYERKIKSKLSPAPAIFPRWYGWEDNPYK